MTMTHDMECVDCETRDGERIITFTGYKLSSASSLTIGKQRWTEMVLYRDCDRDAYVVHGCGRSVISGETNRHWCVVALTASALITALTREAKGVEFIPKINHTLLKSAATVDKSIQAAYYSTTS